MANRKGEFPLDSKVSTRVHSSTKRLLKKLKQKGHNENDVLIYGALKLSDEPLLLEWEIGELEVDIAKKESELFELKSRHKAKCNRLKMIAPNMLDDDVLNGLMKESAKEHAIEIIQSRPDFSIDLLDNQLAKQSIMSVGEEWGYDPLEFLAEVRNQVMILLSDKSV